MKLYEFEGKAIFRKYGIPVPEGAVISHLKELRQVLKILHSPSFALKSQILTKGRGKAGGIKFADRTRLREVASSLLGSQVGGIRVERLLIEERLDIEAEYYLALTVDRTARDVCLLASLEGGIEIEQLAQTHPEKIVRIPISASHRIRTTLSSFPLGEKWLALVKKLWQIMTDCDAELVEINPLARVRNRLIAADSRIVIDDNALFRHPEFENERELSSKEAEARAHGLTYVELDGDIGVIGNGAGLVMSTLDTLAEFGGRAANFLDLGGGASAERVKKALEIVLAARPRRLLINVFGGITRCDEVARGIVKYKEGRKIEIPLVVRLTGTRDREARVILKRAGIRCARTMEEAVREVVR
jgi:succinyl-CoA synthetase beta subunit